MTPVEFCYWLRGSTELHPIAEPSPEQWASIREHVGLATSDLSPAPINIACDRFCHWLKGCAQLSAIKPGPDEWLMIQECLAKVFVKVTPNVNFRLDKGVLRTMELRPSDVLRDRMFDYQLAQPGSAPAITC